LEQILLEHPIRIRPESTMAEWFVRYLDVQTNRETESRRMDTRDAAILLALDREREGCIIHAIVGPDGEEPWGI
jgi:hypothetical protein